MKWAVSHFADVPGEAKQHPVHAIRIRLAKIHTHGDLFRTMVARKTPHSFSPTAVFSRETRLDRKKIAGCSHNNTDKCNLPSSPNTGTGTRSSCIISPDCKRMLPGNSPSIQDDAVFAPSSAQRHRVQQEQQALLTKSHTSALPDEEEVCVEDPSECTRYLPDELTKEELEFFLSINFEDDDDTATTKADNSTFDSSSVRLQQEDSTSTLQSDTSSISGANRSACHSNFSFPTLNKPGSNGSLSNQVLRGQEIKLVTTMKRSAESREAVQRMGHKIFPASLPNATFSIDTPVCYFNQGTKKRKLEAMDGGKDISYGSAANLALPDKPIAFSFHLMDSLPT